MEAAAALVIPRLAEECSEDAALREHILDRVLEQEAAIRRVQRIAVPQVDLVLRGAELMVAREGSDTELIDHAHQMEEVSVRIYE